MSIGVVALFPGLALAVAADAIRWFVLTCFGTAVARCLVPVITFFSGIHESISAEDVDTFELTRSGTAVAVRRIPIVTLLTRVDDGVAAEFGVLERARLRTSVAVRCIPIVAFFRSFRDGVPADAVAFVLTGTGAPVAIRRIPVVAFLAGIDLVIAAELGVFKLARIRAPVVIGRIAIVALLADIELIIAAQVRAFVLAGRGTAIARRLVAVVAFFAGIDDYVAAELGILEHAASRTAVVVDVITVVALFRSFRDGVPADTDAFVLAGIGAPVTVHRIPVVALFPCIDLIVAAELGVFELTRIRAPVVIGGIPIITLLTQVDLVIAAQRGVFQVTCGRASVAIQIVPVVAFLRRFRHGIAAHAAGFILTSHGAAVAARCIPVVAFLPGVDDGVPAETGIFQLAGIRAPVAVQGVTVIALLADIELVIAAELLLDHARARTSVAVLRVAIVALLVLFHLSVTAGSETIRIDAALIRTRAEHRHALILCIARGMERFAGGFVGLCTIVLPRTCDHRTLIVAAGEVGDRAVVIDVTQAWPGSLSGGALILSIALSVGIVAHGIIGIAVAFIFSRTGNDHALLVATAEVGFSDSAVRLAPVAVRLVAVVARLARILYVVAAMRLFAVGAAGVGLSIGIRAAAIALLGLHDDVVAAHGTAEFATATGIAASWRCAESAGAARVGWRLTIAEYSALKLITELSLRALPVSRPLLQSTRDFADLARCIFGKPYIAIRADDDICWTTTGSGNGYLGDHSRRGDTANFVCTLFCVPDIAVRSCRQAPPIRAGKIGDAAARCGLANFDILREPDSAIGTRRDTVGTVARDGIGSDCASRRDLPDLVIDLIGNPHVPIGTRCHIPWRALCRKLCLCPCSRHPSDRISVGKPQVAIRPCGNALRAVYTGNSVLPGNRPRRRHFPDRIHARHGKPKVAIGAGGDIHRPTAACGIFIERSRGTHAADLPRLEFGKPQMTIGSHGHAVGFTPRRERVFHNRELRTAGHSPATHLRRQSTAITGVLRNEPSRDEKRDQENADAGAGEVHGENYGVPYGTHRTHSSVQSALPGIPHVTPVGRSSGSLNPHRSMICAH